MRRIFALLAVSLTAALLITMLAVGVAGASSSHSANNAAEGHLFSASLAPVLGPKDPTIAGIVPGSFPWVLKSGHVNLSKGGLLEASVEGLLLGPGAPAKLVGTTGPIKQVFASLVCANGPVVSTNPVALSKKGDAHIHQRISLPAQCVGPIVLIRASLDGGPWLAASGF
ncbi:MAG TPA: hypothetical protein VFN02_01350 [Ktedonobacteraceae bacterium]|nr:hypothetical protein [Ktedonobacteraceae bacterium]